MYDDETQNLDSVKMWGSIPPPGTKEIEDQVRTVIFLTITTTRVRNVICLRAMRG
jgi:hypothetical protein